MPTWDSRGTAVFRGTTDGDPEGAIAQANEIEVGFDLIHFRKLVFGESFEDVSYNIEGLHLSRYEIFLKLKPAFFQFDQGLKFQTDGDYRRLVSILLMTDAYLYRVYMTGSNHSAGYLKYSDENGDDYLLHPDDDLNPGILPIKVALLGAPSVSPPSAGLLQWELTLSASSAL